MQLDNSAYLQRIETRHEVGQVYKERREQLHLHYEQENAKTCPFRPAIHSSHPKRPTSTPPGGHMSACVIDDEITDGPLDYR